MTSKIHLYIFLFLLLLTYRCTQKQEDTSALSTEAQVKILFEKKLDHLLAASGRLDSLLQYSADEALIQQTFRETRLAYKHVEPLLEQYNPELAKKLNGPAIDKHDLHAAERKVWHASGFQVVEEYLFPELNLADKEEAAQEMAILHGYLTVYHNDIEGLLLSDNNIFEALRLELLRIMSLGISGFDSPIAFHSMPEAKAALQGISDVLSIYFQHHMGTQENKQLKNELVKAIAFLDASPSFDDFDRLTFISEHLDIISRKLYAYQQQIEIPNNSWLTAVNMEKASFFSKKAFNTDFFAPSFNRNVKAEAVTLGKILFHETLLSGTNTRSCAFCHQPEKAFTDGLSRSKALNGHDDISRNAPSLINATFQRLQFYDSRMNFLEGQVADVVANPNEMHGSVQEAAVRLSDSPEYLQLFSKAFGEDRITAQNLQKAIAAYVRSLNALNAPLDQYLRGDQTAMNEKQIRGFNLFMGKAKCATCHFLPLFNGTVPPLYLDTESEVLGVPAQNDTIHAQVDQDLGKYKVYGGELLRFAFKTPTVRNVALTAPYMHNGVYNTLEEVVDFYNRGGGAGIGIVLDHQTLPPDPLNLSQQEQKDLVGFLHALTDTTGLNSRPEKIEVPENIALHRP